MFHLIVCLEEWARILISTCMWWNYWVLGNESSKRIVGNRTQSPHRNGNSDYSHKLDWKTSSLYGHWVEYTKGSCLSIGSNQTLIQLCLGNLKCKNQKDQNVSKDLYWIPEQTPRISIGKRNYPPLNKVKLKISGIQLSSISMQEAGKYRCIMRKYKQKNKNILITGSDVSALKQLMLLY